VLESSTKKATKAPPPPFTTATLLQAASVTLKLKPKQTADLAQALFALGAITYHRTDSQNFSQEALLEIRKYGEAHGLPLPPKPRTWKSKESAQEAHEAIRPTHLEDKEVGETKEQKELYKLIWNRAVASQLADAEYNVTTVELSSSAGGETFAFKAIGRVLTVPGWRSLTAEDQAEESNQPKDEENGDQADGGEVPPLPANSAVTATGGRVLNKQTRPPALYTQASLIKQLEKEGIGRPSTYPNILQRILTQAYITDTDRYLHPTELGKLIIRELKGRFGFVEYDYTRSFEESLDEIASGKASYLAVISAMDSKLDAELGALHIAPQPTLANGRRAPGSAKDDPSLTEIPCPKCKEGRLRRPTEHRPFYGCNRYRPDKTGCSFAVNASISGKTLTENQIATLCEKGITPVLKGFKNKQGKPFEMAVKLSAETEWRTRFDFPK
jgi:DNA topoisomerase-1